MYDKTLNDYIQELFPVRDDKKQNVRFFIELERRSGETIISLKPIICEIDLPVLVGPDTKLRLFIGHMVCYMSLWGDTIFQEYIKRNKRSVIESVTEMHRIIDELYGIMADKEEDDTQNYWDPDYSNVHYLVDIRMITKDSYKKLTSFLSVI